MTEKITKKAQAAMDRKAEKNRLAEAFDIIEDLKSYVEDWGEDEDLTQDMIEGETDLLEIMDKLVWTIQRDTHAAKSIDAHIGELEIRKKRFKSSIETRKAVLERWLSMAGVKTIQRDIATITLKKGTQSATITDESLIPPKFWVKPDPRLDKAALNKAVKEGDDVPGAELNSGPDSVQIRFK